MSAVKMSGVRTEGAGCNCGARGVQAEPGPPSLSVEPCGLRRLEHASIIWWIEEGRILPPSSHLRLHPMSNDQLHHTSHSRYIRRHNVGVRAQHAPFSRPPISLSLSFSSLLLACIFLDRSKGIF